MDRYGGLRPARSKLLAQSTRQVASLRLVDINDTDFLDAEITPRFPEGLSVLTALGQYRGDQGIIQERTQVLIILFPAESAAESSALLEEIRDEYEQQFQQSSVLRADITQVCTSF